MLREARCVLLILIGIICLLTGPSCTASRQVGYKGRVIDSGTKDPIEGAVVVAIWNERMATPSGGSTRLKEVKEVLTDKNGEWSITGPEEERGDSYYSFVTGTHYIQRPEFIIFKPGYCSWPRGFSIEACKGKIRPGKTAQMLGGESLELPRLYDRERMTIIRNLPSLGMAEEMREKLPLFKELVKQEEEKVRR